MRNSSVSYLINKHVARLGRSDAINMLVCSTMMTNNNKYYRLKVIIRPHFLRILKFCHLMKLTIN